jgi:hypothetical protein
MMSLSRPSDLSGVPPRRKALGLSRASSPRAGLLLFRASPSENGDTLKDSAQMPTSTEASSSDGFLSPRTGTLPQPVQCPTNPQGRVADGGVTPSSDSTMMGATAWRTCMNKQRARHLPHTLASNGFPSPINRQLPPSRSRPIPHRAHDASAA